MRGKEGLGKDQREGKRLTWQAEGGEDLGKRGNERGKGRGSRRRRCGEGGRKEGVRGNSWERCKAKKRGGRKEKVSGKEGRNK